MEESWRNSRPSTSGTGTNTSQRKALSSDVGDDRNDDDASSGSSGDDDDGVSVSSSSTSSSSSNSQNCPICLSRLKKQTLGNPECCDHSFCYDCIVEWSRCTTTCPIDRHPFTSIVVKEAESGQILRKEPVAPRLDAEEAAQDVTHCEVCRRTDREDRMLLCDGCDNGYHLECLTPPLDSVPLDAWFCPRCDRETTRAVPQRRPRAIPRTRANERVRARIAQFLEQQEQLDESDTEFELDPDYESDDGVLYAMAVDGAEPTGRPSVKRTRRKSIKRRLRKKRRIRKRTSEGQSVLRPKKTKRRRRRKKRSRRKGAIARSLFKRSNSDPAISAENKNSIGKTKKRLADRLGIVKPPKEGQHLPQLKATSTEAPAAAGQLSLFGNKNELISFGDENDADNEHNKSDANESILSRKAKAFRTPLRHARTEKGSLTKKGTQQDTGIDLLGGILEGQARLMTSSSNIRINRDGSLEATMKSGADNDSSSPQKGADGADANFGRQKLESAVADVGNQGFANLAKPAEMDVQKLPNKDTKLMQSGKNVKHQIPELSSKRPKLDESTQKQQRSPETEDSYQNISMHFEDDNAGDSSHLPESSSDLGGSYLQYIHPPALSYTAPPAPIGRKKVPLLPSPNIPPSKSEKMDGARHNTKALTDAEMIQTQQHPELQVSSAPLRYVGPGSHPMPASSPPMSALMDENVALQQNAAAIFAAQIRQQNMILQQQALAGFQPGGRRSPLSINDIHGTGQSSSLSMMDLISSASVASQQHQQQLLANQQQQLLANQQQQLLANQQQLLASQQHLSSEHASLEALMSAAAASNPAAAFLAPSSLAAAAVMQNALAAAAARQHHANLISTLRAANAPQQHGLIPAAALVGTSGLAPGVLLASGLPHVWQQQVMGGQPPPPPPPPPVDLQLIPLPPAPYGRPDGTMIGAPPPPPPPPPVPPPTRNTGRQSACEIDYDGPRSTSLDARLSEIELDNSVPPELVSLLHQFAQIKKDQQSEQFPKGSRSQIGDGGASGRSVELKSGQPFVAVPVSPASSDNSFLVLDMATTTPTPEPAEPFPAMSMDEEARAKKPRNTVKFGADVVEADERKVKLSKTEIKQLKRQEKLKKLLHEAGKDGRNGAAVDLSEDAMPSSAVDLKRREKVLAKFNYQAQVEEAVKNALRPYYSKRRITKDEYKDIMRKCVPKVCKKKAEIKPDKIKAFVDSCVSKVLASRSKQPPTAS